MKMYQEAQAQKSSHMIGAVMGAGYGGEDVKLAEAPRMPEIHSQVADLHKSIAAFEMVLGELYKKLAPVSRVEPEKEQTTGNQIGRGTGTELGGQLANLCSRVNFMRNAAQQVTRRIEL